MANIVVGATGGKDSSTPDLSANMDTEIPEGVNSALWDILLSIQRNTAVTEGRATSLEERVSSLEEEREPIVKVKDEVAQMKVIIDVSSDMKSNKKHYTLK